MTDHEKPMRWEDLCGSIPPEPGPAPDVTTAEVRDRYMDGIRAEVWGLGSHTMDDYRTAFDRWLAVHDAEVKATALREAADGIDCRKAALTPGCDVDALDYDTPVDYGTDLAEWWLRARADGMGQP